MKRLKIIIIAVLVATLSFATLSFTACFNSGGGGIPETHLVVFTDRGATLHTEIFYIGEDISLSSTQNPIRDGFNFSGWRIIIVENQDGVLVTTVEAVWIEITPDVILPQSQQVRFYNFNDVHIVTRTIAIGDPIGLEVALHPTRPGHIFSNWEVIATSGANDNFITTVRAVFIPIPSELPPIEFISHTARFFNGSILVSTRVFALGTPITHEDLPSNEDFEFLGWRVDSVDILDGVIITTLSAMWNRLTATEWAFPIVSIQTRPNAGGYTHGLFAGISRRTWIEDARISISNAEEPTFNFDYTPVDVRGRGNSTWGMFYRNSGYDKTPYRIRFPNSLNYFRSMLNSRYKARNWTLIASATDRTLLRHYTAFHLGRSMSGGANFCHVPFNRFVHLYINNEYRGVYKLTDHMDTDGIFYGETQATASGRVNIRGGNMPNAWRDNPYYREFYIEMCVRAGGYQQAPADHHFWIDNWSNSGGGSRRSFELRDDSGLGRAAGPALEREARDFTQRVHDTIRSRNWAAIQQVIHVPSFVDYFIVQDIFMNADLNFSSVHSVIRGTRSNRRMHMGPLWDFDLSANNSQWTTTSPTGGHHAARVHPWFYNLVQHVPQFRALVVARLAEVRAVYLPQTLNHINNLTTTYRADFLRNFDRWQIFGRSIPAGSPAHHALPDFDAHLNQFTTFLTQRAAWMTANIE